jgi:hypothetical protein
MSRPQGRARRKPTLEQLDADHRDDFDVGSGSFDAGAGTLARLRGGAAQDLRVISSSGCWCGKDYGHDWPGRSDGEPHPR